MYHIKVMSGKLQYLHDMDNRGSFVGVVEIVSDNNKSCHIITTDTRWENDGTTHEISTRTRGDSQEYFSGYGAWQVGNDGPPVDVRWRNPFHCDAINHIENALRTALS